LDFRALLGEVLFVAIRAKCSQRVMRKPEFFERV
jgi:hypothetical protein